MFPASFDYRRAATLDEAIQLLAQNADAKLLAGGHSLLPMMKLRLATPATLVDIGRIAALKGITEDGDRLSIGALTTHAEIIDSPIVRARCPVMVEAAENIADPQVRTRGTIGGNVAHADPASDWPGLVLALDGVIHLKGPGGDRQVDAGAFFVDLLTSDIQAGEIITRIVVRTTGPGVGAYYAKCEHPASGYTVCGAAAVVTMAGGKCSAARLCFNGVTATPLDATAVTGALVGTSLDAAALDGAFGHLAIAEPLSDAQSSGEYRAAIARTLGRRSVAAARDRAAS